MLRVTLAVALAAMLAVPAAATAKLYPMSRDVGVYRAPNTGSGIGVVKSGGQVDVQCWIRGQAVGGYDVWDRIVHRGRTAYVHDRYVEMPSGSPGASGVPECTGQGGLINWRQLADGILAKDYQSFINSKPSLRLIWPTNQLNWDTDGCSGPMVIREVYRHLFDKPCQQHDFGYRNYGSGKKLGRNEATRAVVDGRFHTEMRRLCARQFRPGHERSVCQVAAAGVYRVVRDRGDDHFYG
jgi:Prokaryotic phospholipase A2